MKHSLYGEQELIKYLEWPMESLGIFLDSTVLEKKVLSIPNFLSIHYAISKHKQLSLWGITEHDFYRDRLISKPWANFEVGADEALFKEAQERISKFDEFGSGLLRFTKSGQFIDRYRGVHRESMWTLDFSYTSQFENELRAVMDLPLGDVGRELDWMTMEFSAPEQLDMVHPYLHLCARNPRYKFHHFSSFRGVVSLSGSAQLREELEHAIDYLEGVINE